MREDFPSAALRNCQFLKWFAEKEMRQGLPWLRGTAERKSCRDDPRPACMERQEAGGESQGRCTGGQRAKQQPVFLKIVLDIFKKPRYYEVVFQTIP